MKKLEDRETAVRALQRGVRIPLPGGTGATVSSFAQAVLCLSEEDFTAKVKTILRNSRVVDDPKLEPLATGDVLVLSGAMPGLVGAMLRSDSPIKELRAGISSSGDRGSADAPAGDRGGHITLKVFNTVLKDHLEDILAYGAYVDG